MMQAAQVRAFVDGIIARGGQLPPGEDLSPVRQCFRHIEELLPEEILAAERAADLVGLVGGSGSGKSTLGRSLATFMDDDAAALAQMTIGAGGGIDTAARVFYGKIERLQDVYVRCGFRGAQPQVLPHARMVAFLKPRQDHQDISRHVVPLEKLLALLPPEHKELLTKDDVTQDDITEAQMIARNVVDHVYKDYPNGAVPLEDLAGLKRFTSYQDAHKQHRLWPLVERVEIRCQAMAPGLQNAVLLDLPHNADQATIDILDVIIFTIPREKARDMTLTEAHERTLRQAIQSSRPFLMVATKIRDFSVYDELQRTDIVTHANATVQRIPPEHRGQWEEQPITEEFVERLKRGYLLRDNVLGRKEIKEIVGLASCNLYTMSLQDNLRRLFPDAPIPIDRLFAVDTLDAVSIQRGLEEPIAFRTLPATGIPSVLAALAGLVTNVQRQRMQRVMRNLEMELLSLRTIVQNLGAGQVMITDEQVANFRNQAQAEALQELALLSDHWFFALEDAMRKAEDPANAAVLDFARSLQNRNYNAVKKGFAARGGKWCSTTDLAEGFNTIMAKKVLQVEPLRLNVMAGVFFDVAKATFRARLIEVITCKTRDVLADSGMAEADVQNCLAVTTTKVETLLRQVDEEDLMPAVKTAREVFEEPPDATKAEASVRMNEVYDRNDEYGNHATRVQALVNELTRPLGQQSTVGRRLVQNIMRSALESVTGELQRMRKGALDKVNRLLNQMVNEINALRARPGDPTRDCLVGLRTYVSARLAELTQMMALQPVAQQAMEPAVQQAPQHAMEPAVP